MRLKKKDQNFAPIKVACEKAKINNICQILSLAVTDDVFRISFLKLCYWDMTSKNLRFLFIGDPTPGSDQKNHGLCKRMRLLADKKRIRILVISNLIKN